MKSTRASWALVFGAGLALGKLWQDPVPSPAPASGAPGTQSAPQEPPAAAQEPGKAEAANAEPAKPPIGAPKPSPFVGVYRLTARSVDGTKVQAPGSGHLVITARHLVLAAAAPSPRPDRLLMRTSVRTWTPSKERKDRVVTRVLAGWLTDAEDHLVLETMGQEEVRSFELVRGGIRIAEDPRNWLEFERIE